VGMEHAVKAALRADVQPLISKGGHDLPWWQGGVLRLVAGKQDSLALLLAQPVRDQAWTAFTRIRAVTITTKDLPPAPERTQADADMIQADANMLD